MQDERLADRRAGVPVLLQIEDLHVHFATSRGIVRAVEGVSYTVGRGEVVALVGESGCGKSVSALAILRLLAKPAGRVVKGPVRCCSATGRRRPPSRRR